MGYKEELKGMMTAKEMDDMLRRVQPERTAKEKMYSVLQETISEWSEMEREAFINEAIHNLKNGDDERKMFCISCLKIIEPKYSSRAIPTLNELVCDDDGDIGMLAIEAVELIEKGLQK